MSYTALYRKFRPDDLGEVKGQDHIVRTLKNQLKLGRIGHAYLFTGTRGTGKTSVAKIMAKAVNCEHPTENGPCNECAMCRSIKAQSSVNVVELDAASNNSVDNIREIIDTVQYSPAEGKYRVYIIDEVHMLSTGAFNALLKTLEEPPEYVIFILATTEVNKIPVTILSRCQRYDFHRISANVILEQLSALIEKESIEAEEKALRYIAKCADGSMRDGLSLLDQCISFYLGEKLTYDRVLSVIGAVDTDVFERMLNAIYEGNVKSAVSIIEEIVTGGRELVWFVNEFVWYMRNLLLIATSDEDCEDMIDMSGDNIKILKEHAQNIPPDVIIRYIRILSELSASIRYSAQKRVLVEIAVIKMCKPQMETDLTSVKERLRRLEAGYHDNDSATVPSQEVLKNRKEEKKINILPSALSEDVKKVAENWNDIVGSLDAALQNTVRRMTLSIGGGDENELMLVSTNKALTMILENENSYSELCRHINEYVHKDVKINIRHIDERNSREDIYPDIAKLVKSGVDISYE